MSNRRGQPGRRRVVPPHRPPEIAEYGPPRRSLLPTVLWGVGAIVALALLIGLLAVTLPHGFPPRSARAFFGAVILLAVIAFALGAKALEAYLGWREAGAA